MKSICLTLFVWIVLYNFGLSQATADTTTAIAKGDILIEKGSKSSLEASTAFCWSLCSNSFIEAELTRLNKQKLNLSEQFLIRKILEEKVNTYLLLKGQMDYSPEGALPDALDIVQKYGAVPQAIDNKNIRPATDLMEMIALLNGLLDGVLRLNGNSSSEVWRKALQQTLNLYLGEVASFHFNGKRYTPKSFAKAEIPLNPDDYVQLTSWTHFPYYEECILRMPDNWALSPSINLPLNDFMAIVDSALAKGLNILWSGDISEPYFSWENGLAYVPERSVDELSQTELDELFLVPIPEKQIDVPARQGEFDNFSTNSDFIMQVVGKVEELGEREWYLFKNACDLNEDEVFLYISKNYLKLKTVSILVHKDGVPPVILDKIESRQK